MKQIALLCVLYVISTGVSAQSMGGSNMMGGSAGGQSGMGSMMGSEGSGMGSMGGSQMGPASGTPVEGVVRKVDRDAQKITIKHGPIPSLDMPPMTMVYRVKEPSMLDRVKRGDKIRFSADQVGGAYTVMSIEAVQ